MKKQKMSAWQKVLRRFDVVFSAPSAVLAGLSLLTTIYWCWAWSTPLWHPDDYMLATRSNLPFGQFLWADVLRDAARSLMEINGRVSDSVTQVVMSSLPLAIAVAVILHIASAAGTYVCVRLFLPTMTDSMAVLMMILSFAFPFALIHFDSLLAADVFHFYAATVSTLGGYSSAVWTVWLAAKAQKESRFGGYFWAAIVVFLLTGLMHELTAFFLVPALVVLMTGGWKKSQSFSERFLLLPVLMLVLLRFATPGIWRRVGVVNDLVYPEETKLNHFDRLIMAFSRFFTNSFPLMIVFLLLLFLTSALLLSHEQKKLDVYTAGLGAAATLSWIILGVRNMIMLNDGTWNGHHGRSDLGQALIGLVLFLMVAVACACAAYCAVRLSQMMENWFFAAVFFGTVTTALIPLSLGNATGRQVFFLEVFMYVMLLGLLVLMLSHKKTRIHRVGLLCTGCALLFSIHGTASHTVNLSETFEEYAAFTDQIRSVQTGSSTAIDIRAHYTHPHIFDSSYLEREDMRVAIPLFYGLDPKTEVLLP